MTAKRFFKEGDLCGSYVIVGPLGSGGMGDVFKATHRFNQNDAAIKILRKELAGDLDAMTRLTHEAETVSRIRHPNIVAVRDVGVHEDTPWIAMELLVGTTLRRYMRSKGRVPLSDTLFIAREIAEGLDAAHEWKVIHRDIKPDNIFVTSSRQIKIYDFGAAKQLGRGYKSTGEQKILGTPHYMSPEQIVGERADHRTDIFSLGVVLYELLTGQHPFDLGDEPRTVEQVIHRQLHREARPVRDLCSDIPEALSDLTRALLTKRRDDRIGSAYEVAMRLDQFLQEQIAKGRCGELGPYDELERAPATNRQRLTVARPAVVAERKVSGDGSMYSPNTMLSRDADVTLEIPAMKAESATVELLPRRETLRLVGHAERSAPIMPFETGGLSEADWFVAAQLSMGAANSLDPVEVSRERMRAEAAVALPEPPAEPKPAARGRTPHKRKGARQARQRRQIAFAAAVLVMLGTSYMLGATIGFGGLRSQEAPLPLPPLPKGRGGDVTMFEPVSVSEPVPEPVPAPVPVSAPAPVSVPVPVPVSVSVPVSVPVPVSVKPAPPPSLKPQNAPAKRARIF